MSSHYSKGLEPSRALIDVSSIRELRCIKSEKEYFAIDPLTTLTECLRNRLVYELVPLIYRAIRREETHGGS